MKTLFLNFIYNIGGSCKNNTEGYSAKKIIAYALSLCVIIIHFKWARTNDFTLLPTILMSDFGFILALFGINVYDKMKNPNPPAP